MNQVTVGNYLAQRLEEVGIRDYFAIPGDFNLSLLDELLKNSRLKMITCCNELNAGYAADGYAREKGVAALILTFGVVGYGRGRLQCRQGQKSPLSRSTLCCDVAEPGFQTGILWISSR